MRLPFFRKPVRYVPSQPEGSLQDFRERILSILLTSAITLGTLAFITSLIPALRTRQYGSMIIFSVWYVWILIINLQRRRFSYTVKIYSLLFLFYLLGFTNLLQSGLSSNAGVFLLAFTIMTSLLIGPRSGRLALLISLGTYALVSVLMISSQLIPLVQSNYRESMDWLGGGMVFILSGTILVLSLNIIEQGLKENIAKVRTLAIDADRDREQLKQRSQDFNHRLAQLRAVAEIEHTISAFLEPKDLLQKVVDLLGERFGLYFVGVFLLDETASFTAMVASEAEAPFSERPVVEVGLQASTNNSLPRGYSLPLSENSGIRWSIINQKPHTVDVSSRKDEFTATYLPQARTELALPLISHNHAIGALMIYSTQANAFDGDDIALFQSSSESLTTALINARLFTQTQADLEEIRALQRQYVRRTWAETEQIHGNLSYTYEAGTELQDQTEPAANTPLNSSPSTYNTPINLRDQTIGQITLEADKPAWSDEERTFIESVITEAALALENARLLEEIRSHARQEQLIGQVSAQFQGSLDMDAILRAAVRQIGQLPGVSEASIHIRPGIVGN